MTKRIKRGAKAPAHPTWLRVLALLCVFLIGFTSSAQASHVHGDWLPHHAAQLGSAGDDSQVPGGEINCPLCMAMQMSLPVSAQLAPIGLVLMECRLTTTIDHVPVNQWHFAMFSRPPPALKTL